MKPDTAPDDHYDVNNTISQQMRATYDRYFQSSGYHDRYPVPNGGTLDYVMRHGARDAKHILDFGCGDGRYALALLDRTDAYITGFDVSASSLKVFSRNIERSHHGHRVRLLGGNDQQVFSHAEKYDQVLMLFGVLSHIGNRDARISTLRRLNTQMAPGAQLVLSVPSIYRRRPFDVCRHGLRRSLGRAHAPYDEPGNIDFVRTVNGDRLHFFYHLYTVNRLRNELGASGFVLRHCEAESVFPEWWLMRSQRLQKLDRALAARIPPTLGYGIRAVAEPIR